MIEAKDYLVIIFKNCFFVLKYNKNKKRAKNTLIPNLLFFPIFSKVVYKTNFKKQESNISPTSPT